MTELVIFWFIYIFVSRIAYQIRRLSQGSENNLESYSAKESLEIKRTPVKQTDQDQEELLDHQFATIDQSYDQVDYEELSSSVTEDWTEEDLDQDLVYLEDYYDELEYEFEEEDSESILLEEAVNRNSQPSTRISSEQLRRAIIWSELLAKPKSLRN